MTARSETLCIHIFVEVEIQPFLFACATAEERLFGFSSGDSLTSESMHF